MTTLSLLLLGLLHSTTIEAFHVPVAARLGSNRVSPLVVVSPPRPAKDVPRISSSSSTVLVLHQSSSSSYGEEEELPKFPEDSSNSIVPPQNKQQQEKEKVDMPNSNNNNNDNLLTRLNNLGQSFKPKAQEVNLRATQVTKQKRKIGLKIKACLYYTLYIAYRGYRGFFVILPAVFREVYHKMETAVDYRVLDDDNDNSTTTVSGPVDINPSTGKVRWRTRITVSVLAAIVTMTYVVGGLARVLAKFVKTILSTSSLSGSFSAAAEEVEGNEGRLMKLSGKESSSTEGINGRRNTNSSSSNSDIGF